MNKSTIISFLFLLIGTLSFAQEERLTLTPAERAERTTKTMTEKLVLNEDQVLAITAVNRDFYASRTERPNFREMSEEDRTAFRDEMREKNEIYQASLEAILTKEQFEQWNLLQNERRGNRGNSGAAPGRN